MSRRTIIMTVLSVISVIVLAVLFVVSGKSGGEISGQTRGEAAVKSEHSDCFQFEPETLTYDGEGELDLLYGVTFTDLTAPDAVKGNPESGSKASAENSESSSKANTESPEGSSKVSAEISESDSKAGTDSSSKVRTDSSKSSSRAGSKRGQELRDIVFVRISAGTALYRKNITYTAQLSNGETATAVRPLRLEGYSRPTITMPSDDKLPQLTRETMDSIQSEVMDTKGFKADDGFGNDARDHIEVSYKTDRLDSSLVHYTYELVNPFNDKAVTSLDMELPSTEARIILSTASVTITQEDPFNAMDYIVRAANSDGSDGRYNIKVSGKVDQSKPGNNTVSFDLENAHMELTVNVVKGG